MLSGKMQQIVLADDYPNETIPAIMTILKIE